ncbi:MAG: hypothetical protein Q4G34_03990 [Micrococcus sp.]|nr:hypothetical protein [Micrococcus sp.]
MSKFSPGPGARLLRQPLDALVALALSAALVLTGLVSLRAQLQVSDALDQNWRGAYDLLVTASAAEVSQCQDGDSRLLAPNFAGFANTNAMSAQDLEAVRATDGVDIAAPIGLVGSLDPVDRSVILATDLATTTTPGALGLAVDVDLVIDDGASAQNPVESEQVRIYSSTGLGSGIAAQAVASPSNESVGQIETEDHVLTDLLVVKSPRTTVVAVDAVAEKALLGAPGSFLSPLAKAAQRQADDGNWGLRAPEFIDPLLETHPELMFFQTMWPGNEGLWSTASVLPLIFSEDSVTNAQLDITFHNFVVPDSTPEVEDYESTEIYRNSVLRAPLAGNPLSSENIDFSSAYRPFYLEGLSITAPGSSQYFNTHSITHIPTMTSGYPAPPALEAGEDCALTARPQGWVNARGEKVEPEDASYVEQAYRDLERSEDSLPSEDDEPIDYGYDHVYDVIPFGVGFYSVDDVAPLTESISAMPLGSYAPVTAGGGETRAATGDDTRPLRPGHRGLGLVPAPAGAITTLAGGEELRGENFIDAIRVRVADVTAYNEEGRQRVAQTAAALQELGYTVTVMAGASFDPVQIHAVDLIFDREANTGSDRWVTQDWSVLDAAARVQQAQDSVGETMALFAVAVALLIAGIIAGRSVGRHRADLHLLASLGWTRRARILFAAGPVLLSAAVVAAAAGLTLALPTLTGTPALLPWWLILTIPLLYAVMGLGGVAAAVRGPRPPRTRAGHNPAATTARHRVPASAAQFGGLRLRRHLPDAALTILTLVVVGIGAALLAAAVIASIAATGTTRLGTAATEQALPTRIALVVTVVAVTTLLMALLHQATATGHRHAHQQLRALGFSSRQRQAWVHAEIGPLLIFATAGAAAAALAMSALTGHSPALLTLTAVLAATVAGAGLWWARLRGTRA